MKPVFFLRHFNDVDHIAPIMWHCLEQGDNVQAIFLDINYPVDNDPRIKYLRRFDKFNVGYVDSLFDINWRKPLFSLDEHDGRSPQGLISKYLRKGMQISGLGWRKIAPILREINPTACIFEWGSPYSISHREFFEAADALNIPTLSFPHGLNIYLNEDIHPWRKEIFEQGNEPMTSRNKYDAYVTQSEYDKVQEGKLGVDPNNHYVLGSARYYPEWQSINQELYDKFEENGISFEKVKIVFMLPHWKYNVDKETTLDLLRNLANHEWVYLIVKEHTRGDSLPQELYNRFMQQENTEVVAEIPSVSLIKWSEAVINFGSSIGIEALQQDKNHVNPSYLHSNKTIFDETGAGYQPKSNQETVALLEKIHRDDIETTSDRKKDKLYEAVVYGGQSEHNVLKRYRSLIQQLGQT